MKSVAIYCSYIYLIVATNVSYLDVVNTLTFPTANIITPLGYNKRFSHAQCIYVYIVR